MDRSQWDILPKKSKHFEAVAALVKEERKRQDLKWGWPQRNSLPEWSSILGEEFGELCQEINRVHFGKGRYDDPLIDETIQVAAVAFAMIETWIDEGKITVEKSFS